MNKLVPEIRVNKNGVPVKKYVNPDKKKSAGSMPSPSLQNPLLTEEHVKAAAAAVFQISEHQKNIMGEGLSEEWRLIYAKSFMHLSNETLLEIERIGSEAKFAEEPTFRYDCIRILVVAKAGEQQYKHLLSLADFLTNHEIMGENGPEYAIALTLTMTEYDKHLDHRGVKDNRSSYYLALCKTTMEIEEILGEGDMIEKYSDGSEELDYDNPEFPIRYKEMLPSGDVFGSPLIRDPKLTDLIIDNVDRVDEVVSLIRERREFDADVLGGYLNGAHRSISDGLI